MLTHADRHLPCTQRPHTRCISYIRSLTHSSCLTHTHHTTHTCGGTHPQCLTHTEGFAHACRSWRTRGLFRLQCPFHTRRAGKHALRHTRDYTTRTRGLFHTRGRTHTRGSSQTMPFPRAMRALQHAFRHACVHTRRHHTHRDHTRNHTHRGFSPPLGLLGPPYRPSSACTRSQHSSPRPRKARPNLPGRDPLQGGILPPLVPEGGYPTACTGSQHALRAHPHCPPLPVCVCVCVFFNPVCTV